MFILIGSVLAVAGLVVLVVAGLVSPQTDDYDNLWPPGWVAVSKAMEDKRMSRRAIVLTGFGLFVAGVVIAVIAAAAV